MSGQVFDRASNVNKVGAARPKSSSVLLKIRIHCGAPGRYESATLPLDRSCALKYVVLMRPEGRAPTNSDTPVPAIA